MGIASDDYNAGLGIVVGNFPQELPCLFFCHIGHAAGVDDENIGGRMLVDGFGACLFEEVADGGGLGEVEFASEGDVGYFFAGNVHFVCVLLLVCSAGKVT